MLFCRLYACVCAGVFVSSIVLSSLWNMVGKPLTKHITYFDLFGVHCTCHRPRPRNDYYYQDHGNQCFAWCFGYFSFLFYMNATHAHTHTNVPYSATRNPDEFQLMHLCSESVKKIIVDLIKNKIRILLCSNWIRHWEYIVEIHFNVKLFFNQFIIGMNNEPCVFHQCPW